MNGDRDREMGAHLYSQAKNVYHLARSFVYNYIIDHMLVEFPTISTCRVACATNSVS